MLLKYFFYCHIEICFPGKYFYFQIKILILNTFLKFCCHIGEQCAKECRVSLVGATSPSRALERGGQSLKQKTHRDSGDRWWAGRSAPSAPRQRGCPEPGKGLPTTRLPPRQPPSSRAHKRLRGDAEEPVWGPRRRLCSPQSEWPAAPGTGSLPCSCAPQLPPPL